MAIPESTLPTPRDHARLEGVVALSHEVAGDAGLVLRSLLLAARLTLLGPLSRCGAALVSHGTSTSTARLVLDRVRAV